MCNSSQGRFGCGVWWGGVSWFASSCICVPAQSRGLPLGVCLGPTSGGWNIFSQHRWRNLLEVLRQPPTPINSFIFKNKQMKIVYFHLFIFKKINKWKRHRFWPFLGHDRDLAPPPSTPLGGFLGQLSDVILGGPPFKLTWQVDLISCHLSRDLKRCRRRRGWQVNLTSATCQVDFSRSTCAQTQV